MQTNEPFRFKSKLLKNRTAGLASIIEMAGGQDCHVEINELLALAGADGNTPWEEVEEAKAELKAAFSNKSHPFWTVISDRENEIITKILADIDAKKKADWNALSMPRKIFKTVATFVVPLLAIYFASKYIL